MRRRRVSCVAVLIAAGLQSGIAAAQQPSAPPGGGGTDEWRPTGQSLLDHLDAGYALVSVVGSPQQRAYFLNRGASLIKCSEQAVPTEPPPLPPDLATAPGLPPSAAPPPTTATRPGAQPSPGTRPVMLKPTKTAARIECSELTRLAAGRTAR